MKIWTGHYGSVLGLSYAPGGKSLASCSTDGRVIVWACPSYTQRALCVCRGKVDSLAWVSRKVLATNSPGLSAALPELAVGGGADATEGCVTLWYVPTGAADPLPLCTLRHEVSSFGQELFASVVEIFSSIVLLSTGRRKRRCDGRLEPASFASVAPQEETGEGSG